MTAITINGHDYSDDGTTSGDMQHYGYLTNLLPMIGDVVTVAGDVAADAAQAASDAASASNAAAAVRGTSTTSLTVAAGSQALTTQSGKQFAPGNYVTISRTSAPTTLMHGVVTAYSGTSLTVDVATIAGAGTFTDWTIALSGAKGDTGATGNGQLAYLAKTGAYTVTAADKGKLIDCTSGTFTLSFQACATLGADWTTYIRNSGAGVITLDPDGAETIDDAETLALNPGFTAALQGDGSSLRSVGYLISPGYLHVQDQKASGTASGTSTAGLNVRVLNTVLSNSIAGASLASNLVTLPAGTYDFIGSAPLFDGGASLRRLALYNHTDGADIIVGATTTADNSVSYVGGRFTLSTSKDVKLRQFVTTGRATNGLGQSASTGQVEVFAELQIWRAL